MRIGEAFRVAFGAILANRLRSALTMIGVIIGVLAVVLLVAIGQGAREEVTGQIEDLGSNLLIVLPGEIDFSSGPARSRFTLNDVDRIARSIGDADRVAAYLFSGETVRAGNASAFSTVLGVTEKFPLVITRDLARGQELGSSDIVTGRRVAVLGAQVAEELYGALDAVGKQMTIAGLRFRVIGVLERVGGTPFGPDRDGQILIPITAAQRLFGTSRVDAIFVKARSTAEIPEEALRIRTALNQRFEEDSYSVVTQEELIGIVGDILELLTFVVAAIAGISLLVGGVGVSNIMLVSVSERTREIGLRKALGARTRDITWQFLIEAMALTMTGGLIGLGGAIGLASVVERVAPIPARVTLWSVLLALGVSLAVGLIFGVLPARRAGKLDPVTALRHE